IISVVRPGREGFVGAHGGAEFVDAHGGAKFVDAHGGAKFVDAHGGAMVAIALAFLTGHCVIHGLPRLPDLTWLALVLVASCAVLFARPFAAGRPCVSSMRKVLLAAAFGLLWAWGHAAMRVADDLPAALEGR